MANYNPYFPVGYQPYTPYPAYPQQMQNAQQQPAQIQQQQGPQIQNGGLVQVPSEEVARNYPVALGNSVTFVDENAKYCYTKTMGFSPLEAPRFERYRLVKEEPRTQAPAPAPAPASAAEPQAALPEYATKEDVEAFRAELDGVKKEIKSFLSKKEKAVEKSEVSE